MVRRCSWLRRNPPESRRRQQQRTQWQFGLSWASRGPERQRTAPQHIVTSRMHAVRVKAGAAAPSCLPESHFAGTAVVVFWGVSGVCAFNDSQVAADNLAAAKQQVENIEDLIQEEVRRYAHSSGTAKVRARRQSCRLVVSSLVGQLGWHQRQRCVCLHRCGSILEAAVVSAAAALTATDSLRSNQPDGQRISPRNTPGCRRCALC